MGGLAVGEFATAIMAELDGHTLRWSNAGHPPPALLDPDGRARLLHTEPEPLLGIASGARTEHTVELAAGAVLVLYTDGLVERREVPIDRGLEGLAAALESGRELGAEALCDHLLAQLHAVGDDDVALLVLRLDPATGAEPPARG